MVRFQSSSRTISPSYARPIFTGAPERRYACRIRNRSMTGKEMSIARRTRFIGIEILEMRNWEFGTHLNVIANINNNKPTDAAHKTPFLSTQGPGDRGRAFNMSIIDVID